MAKADVTLSIKTLFKGEGMKQLDNAMKNASGQAKNASKAIGSISTALGGLGGEAGKVTAQVGGMIQAFATMGVVGGVIAAGSMAIEGLFKWLNKTNDALAKLASGFGDKLKAGVAKANAEIAKTNKLFANLISGNKTRAEREDITASGDVSMMEEKKKQALAGKEGVEAAKIELEWTKRIEEAKERQSKKHLQDVKTEIALTEANMRKQEEAQDKAFQKFKRETEKAMERFNSGDMFSEVEKSEQADRAQIAKRQYMAYAKPIEDLKKKLEELRTQELRAVKEAEVAPERRRTAIMQGEAKVVSEQKKEDAKKLADAEKRQAEKEKKEREAQALEDKQTRKEIREQQKTQKQMLKDFNEEQKRLTEEERKLKEELTDAQDGAKSLADAARDIANGWKNNANGGPFSGWEGDKRRGEADKAREQRRIDRDVRNAEKEQQRLAGKIFDDQGNVRKAATKFDIGRFANVTDFLGGKGLTDAQRAGLEKAAEKNPAVKELLDKMKTVEDANKKQEELKKIQEEQKKLAERRTAAIEKIQTAIEGLQDKLGM